MDIKNRLREALCENISNDDRYVEMIVNNDVDNEDFNSFYSLPRDVQKNIMDMARKAKEDMKSAESNKTNKKFTDFIPYKYRQDPIIAKHLYLPLNDLISKLTTFKAQYRDYLELSFGNKGMREKANNLKTIIDSLEIIISAHNKADNGLSEGNYIVKSKDLDKLGDDIMKKDPKAIIKVIDESEDETDESYNIYAVCSSSIAKTAGTPNKSEWSEEDNAKYEKCVKGLKHKKGYKLGESVNPKMTKQELIETVVGTERKIVKTIKLKDIK